MADKRGGDNSAKGSEDEASKPQASGDFIRHHSYDGTYFDVHLDKDGNPLPGEPEPEWDRETGWGHR